MSSECLQEVVQDFSKNVQGWFENASPSDWLKLEAQDPSGRLRKLNFEQIMKRLVY